MDRDFGTGTHKSVKRLRLFIVVVFALTFFLPMVMPIKAKASMGPFDGIIIYSNAVYEEKKKIADQINEKFFKDAGETVPDAVTGNSAGYRSWANYDKNEADYWAIDKGGDKVPTVVEDKKPNVVEKALSEILVGIGNAVNHALTGNGIDASTEGVILGNVTKANGAGVPYFFVFDLTDNNVYGTIGAIIYAVMRSVMMGFLFLIVLISLVKVMWSSQAGRDLSDFKGVVYAAIIAMVLLFLMPQIIDWLCYIRNALQVVVYNMMTGTTSGVSNNYSVSGGVFTNGQSMTSMLYMYWEMGTKPGTGEFDPKYAHSLADGIVYFAFCFIPFIYMISYVKIAIEQTILFGAFPAICVLSVKNKQLLSNWLTAFITNIFIPVIDLVMIMLPMMLKKLIGLKGGGGSPFLLSIILIITMTAAIPARNKLLQVLGNAFGVQMGGFGFGALAGIGTMAFGAARDLFGGLRGSGSGGGSGIGDKVSATDVAASEEEARAEGKQLGDELKHLNDVSGVSKADDGTAQEGLKELGPPPGESAESFSKQDDQQVLSEEQQRAADEAAMSAGAGAEGSADQSVLSENGEPAEPGAVNVQTEGQDVRLEGENAPDMAKMDEQNVNVDADVKGADADKQMPDEKSGGGLQSAALSDADKSGVGNKPADPDGKDLASVQPSGSLRDQKLQQEIGERVNTAFPHKQMGESQKEFDAKKKEFENNLTNRGQNLERRQQLQFNNNEIKKANAGAEAKIQASRSSIDRNNAEIAQLKRENANYKAGEGGATTLPSGIMLPSGLSSSQHKIAENNARIAELEAQNVGHQSDINGEQMRIKTNNEELAANQVELDKRKNIEQRYAKASEHMGMSNKTYENADEFRQALAHENRVAKNATYKNFQARETQGVLTMREKKAYQAAATRRQVVRVAGSAAGLVAGTAAGVGLAAGISVAGAYGGEDSMRAMGRIGGMAVPLVARGGMAAGGAVATAAYNAGAMTYKNNPSYSKVAKQINRDGMSERKDDYRLRRERDRQVVTANDDVSASRSFRRNPDAAFKTESERNGSLYSGDFGARQDQKDSSRDNFRTVDENKKQNSEFSKRAQEDLVRLRNGSRAEEIANKGNISRYDGKKNAKPAEKPGGMTKEEIDRKIRGIMNTMSWMTSQNPLDSGELPDLPPE